MTGHALTTEGTQGALPMATGSEMARYVLATVGAMSQLKLQKLLYYIDAWHLAFFDQPLFEESFEAWLHGPVLRSVWGEYRDVSVLYNEIAPSSDNIINELAGKLSVEQLEVISDVLAEYGDKTAYHLECLTHAEAPWIEARKCVPEGAASTAAINKETTMHFYQARLA